MCSCTLLILYLWLTLDELANWPVVLPYGVMNRAVTEACLYNAQPGCLNPGVAFEMFHNQEFAQ